jgi:hypothetical protein
MSISHNVPSHHGRRRAAGIGALALAILMLFLWASSAAQALPSTAPDFVRDFTPGHGMVRLTVGLALAGATGAMLGLIGAGLWRLTRSMTPPSSRA